MIVFSCPHCGNGFEVADTYAGRDGWCRRCKQMVTVPARNGSPQQDAAAADNYARLSAAFQYAARKADKYQVLYDKARSDHEAMSAEMLTMTERLAAIDQRLVDAEATIEITKSMGISPVPMSVKDELGPVELRLARLEADVGRTAEQIASATEPRESENRFDEVLRQVDRIKVESGEERTLRAAFEESLKQTTTELTQIREATAEQEAKTHAAIEQVRQDVEAERAARADATATLEATNAALARLGDDQAEAAQRLSALAERTDALTDVEHKLVTMAGDVEHGQATGQHMAASLAVLAESLSTIQSHAAVNTSEVERLASHLTGLRNQLEADRVTQEEVLAQLRDRADAVDKRIEDLSVELGSLRTEMEQTAAGAGALQGEFLDRESPRLEGPQVRAEDDSEVVVLSEVVEDDVRVSQETVLGSFLRFIGPSQRQTGPKER